MQAMKDKIQDLKATQKARSDAKAEEKAEKELAKARMDVAHEVRLAKEAEAAMEKHVAKAGEIAEKEAAKHHPSAAGSIESESESAAAAAAAAATPQHAILLEPGSAASSHKHAY